MAISKEAKALLTAQEASLNVASKELKNILKESKNMSKKLNKEYRGIANRPILKFILLINLAFSFVK